MRIDEFKVPGLNVESWLEYAVRFLLASACVHAIEIPGHCFQPMFRGKTVQ